MLAKRPNPKYLLPVAWFARDAVALAPLLLGKVVRRGYCFGKIVEMEAYTDDLASHATKPGARGRLMCETFGHWYVHFTYGMHWCANVTFDARAAGAVLIRAVEPLGGFAEMESRRHSTKLPQLCSGPAKFC